MASVGLLQKCSAFGVLSEVPKTPGIKSVQQCSSQLHTDQNAAFFFPVPHKDADSSVCFYCHSDEFSSAFRPATGLRKRMRQMKEQSSTREGDSPALF